MDRLDGKKESHCFKTQESGENPGGLAAGEKLGDDLSTFNQTDCGCKVYSVVCVQGSLPSSPEIGTRTMDDSRGLQSYLVSGFAFAFSFVPLTQCRC